MKAHERFLEYVAFATTSDENSESCPSTEAQLVFAKYLAGELAILGLKDVKVSAKGYVYAYLPPSEGLKEDLPAIGLIAHMDTSDGAPGENIKPSIINYKGGDIQLADGSTISPKDFDFLESYINQELIVTDGTTLLGADDKAGIAEIVTAMEYLLAHPDLKHGKICLGFTPDEEIGRGADFFDIEGFGADFAYTVDGGTLGELEYENFNAASASLEFTGFNVHPGSAKNKMKNACLMVQDFLNLLPSEETPASTEGYEGFFHITSLKGDESSAEIKLLIRDHDRKKFEDRKEFIRKAAALICEKYGPGSAKATLRDSYYNMKEYILPVMHVVERAKKAMEAAGVTPIICPIRGGTDGAHLSAEGLPCPNISTGGENFHGTKEFVSLQAMEKMVEIIVNISKAE